MKNIIITGITGQDGSYLCELLLEKGYIVHGLRRKVSVFNTNRIDHLVNDNNIFNKKLFLHYNDLTDSLSIVNLISKIKPDEIYNLAAMSHVHVSFMTPEYVGQTDALGTLRILEAVRILGLKTKIYQASTSELYGKVVEIPQSEKTPFYPRSPYGVAKLYAFWISKNYREAYNMFVSNGILFNHESPRRGENFVTQKIVNGIIDIINCNKKFLTLGNLNSIRDWGHAKDYVEAMYLVMQHSKADDFVIATGKVLSVRDFAIKCFEYLNIKVKFKGDKINEKGIVISAPKKYDFLLNSVVIKVNKKYFRPSEVDYLQGDSSKAKKLLGWEPKYSIDDLIKEMMDSKLKK